jgi:hypothetical protein
MFTYPPQDPSIEVPIPAPTKRTTVSKYGGLIDLLLQANGEWLAIDPSAITGATNKRKTITLHSIAAERGVKVNTLHQNGWMYARLIDGTTTGRHRYGSLLETIRKANGAWLELDTTTIGGSSIPKKQQRILNVAKNHNLKIETRSEGEKIFARLIVVGGAL